MKYFWAVVSQTHEVQITSIASIEMCAWLPVAWKQLQFELKMVAKLTEKLEECNKLNCANHPWKLGNQTVPLGGFQKYL